MTESQKAYAALMQLFAGASDPWECRPYTVRVVSSSPEAANNAFYAARMLVAQSPFARERLYINCSKREIWLDDGSGVIEYVAIPRGGGMAAACVVRDETEPCE